MMILAERPRNIVGRFIPLELITLCCVSLSLLDNFYHNSSCKFEAIKTNFRFQVAGEIANYFIICIQLFLEDPG